MAAPKGNKFAVGKGRPTDYRPEYDKLALNYCLLGAKDEQLAEYFDVSVATITTWKNEHPSFLAALRSGKEEADAKVAGQLYHRALGYDHKEDKIFLHEGVPVIVPTTKHYPPDATSAIFWLKNRRPKDWRDTQTLANDPDNPLIKQPDEAEIVRRLAFLLAKNAPDPEQSS